MEFIFKVLGSNVVIFVGSFFYLYIMFTVYKTMFSKDLKEWRKYGFMCAYNEYTIGFNMFAFYHLPYVIFWPVSIIIHIIIKGISLFVPMTFKFFDKITPTIKIEKEEK